MTKAIPKIQKFMTVAPISITRETSLKDAAAIMHGNQIRHLPVTMDGKIDGILSSTDVNMIRTLNGVDMDKLKVNDCYTANPYKVGPEAGLNEVMDEMAENKYGCVLVEDNGHLVGIFTWVDALKATKTLLETRLKK